MSKILIRMERNLREVGNCLFCVVSSLGITGVAMVAKMGLYSL